MSSCCFWLKGVGIPTLGGAEGLERHAAKCQTCISHSHIVEFDLGLGDKFKGSWLGKSMMPFRQRRCKFRGWV